MLRKVNVTVNKTSYTISNVTVMCNVYNLVIHFYNNMYYSRNAMASKYPVLVMIANNLEYTCVL